jgi:adenylate kinase family enzyme
VTTLGAALAARLDLVHLDTDDFYWLPSTPPFQHKRPIADRLEMMEQAMARAAQGWVLSGSMDPWRDGLLDRIDLVIFLQVPTEVRMARLRAREQARFGAAIEPGGPQYESSKAFLDWCAGYEIGDQPGRSLKRHQAWLNGLIRPALRLEATATTEELTRQTLAHLAIGAVS